MAPVVGAAGPAIALLELASIAVGHRTLDALLKQAEVQLLVARPVSPGRWIILITGQVEELSSALRRGVEVAGAALVDRLFIPNVEPSLLALVSAPGAVPESLDAVGTLETLSVASVIAAGDAAAKAASISLLSLGLARGLGGKCWVSFTGELSDVSAAMDAGAAAASTAGMLLERVVIPRPDPRLGEILARGVDLS
ncbi:MAG: propanediol utilization protein [Planctomycetota bacterium]|nr:MAG: propanediol utilization protein [Planctomycetota bacterium]